MHTIGELKPLSFEGLTGKYLKGMLRWPPTVVERHLSRLLIGTLPGLDILPGLAKNSQVQVYSGSLHAILWRAIPKDAC